MKKKFDRIKIERAAAVLDLGFALYEASAALTALRAGDTRAALISGGLCVLLAILAWLFGFGKPRR